MMFDNEILHWMRYRMNALFPTVYPRQQNMYRIYSSQARRGLFQTFQNTRNTIQAPTNSNDTQNIRSATNSTRIVWPATPITVSTQRISIPPSAVAPASAPAPTSAPARIIELSVSPISSTQEPAPSGAPSTVPTTAPPTAPPTAPSAVPPAVPPAVPNVAPASQVLPTVQARSSMLLPASGRGLASLGVQDPLEDLLTALLATTPQTRQSDSALLTSMLGGLGGLGSLGSLGVWTTARNELLTDVVVIPTHAQVEEGSEIVHLEDVPDEVACAVCQERGSDTTWRHLYCEHYFHRDCVDRWFSRNVHCPVCRADIRTPNSE